MLQDLRRLFSFLNRRSRWRWIALVPLTIVSAGLEALGTLLVLAWIQLITNPGGGLVLSSGRPLQLGTDLPLPTLLTYSSIGVAAFFLIKNGYVLLLTYVANRLAAATTVSVSSRLLKRYLHASYDFFFQRNSAHLANNLVLATEKVFTNMLRSGADVFSEVFLLLAVLGVLIYAAPGGTLLAVLALSAFLGILLRITQGLFTRLGRTVHRLHSRLFQLVHHSLGSIKEAKLLQLEDFFSEHFSKTRSKLARSIAIRGTLDATPRLLLEALFICIVATLVVLLTVVQDAGDQALPLLALFAFAGFRMLPALHRTVHHLNSFRFGRAALDDIERDWNTVGEFLERQRQVEQAQPTTEVMFATELRLDRVDYVYPGSQHPALSNVSTQIVPGQSVGIVGSTGAGKSTLLDLILGLLVPTSGSIRIDGEDLQAARRFWFPKIGYVPQDIYLLDDTIEANIAFGIAPKRIDHEKVRQVLAAAQALQFVDALPDGLQTRVGERGIRLSGGQKQRIAIARALYRDPSVLVFDEATSALDHVTERELTTTITGLKGSRTIIVVAHRITTVQHCDEILLLEQGRLVAQGPYDELARTSPQFRQLAGLDVDAA